VRLGNFYGVSWSAKPIADRTLKKQTADRWAYYLEKILPGEIRILEKLLDEKPRSQWMSLLAEIPVNNLAVREKSIKDLIDASTAKNERRVILVAERLMTTYYGKGKVAPL
jgi:hypothetical protein